MTRFTIVSPIGHARVEPHAERRRLGSATGKRVGFIWNQYPTTAAFWTHLERALEALCQPSIVHRMYKRNTWMPLDPAAFGELASKTDYLVVGVGA